MEREVEIDQFITLSQEGSLEQPKRILLVGAGDQLQRRDGLCIIPVKLRNLLNQ